MPSALRPALALAALLAAACAGDSIGGPPRVARLTNGVTVRAESEVLAGDGAPSVRVRTIFTNGQLSTATVEPTNCMWVRLRAHRLADGAVLLDETRMGVMCIANASVLKLAPLSADTVVRTLTAADFVGQPGSTRIRIESFVYAAHAEPDGELMVAAGTVPIP